MAVVRTNFDGNPFLGLFVRAVDDYVVIPLSASEKFEMAAKTLGGNIIRASVSSSPYIGLYSVANSNGIALAPFCNQREIDMFEKTGANIEIIKDTKFSALGNNIACNDNGAIVNEDMTRKDIKMIEDALGVEAVPMKIYEYKTIGMMIAVTNKGFMVHNRINEDEMKELTKIFKVEGLNGTINCGTAMVGLGITANSKSALIGQSSTGFEMGRVEQALELTD